MELEVHRDESIEPCRCTETYQGQLKSIPTIRGERWLAEVGSERPSVIRQAAAYEGWPAALPLRYVVLEPARHIGNL